jgi:HEPN domain-containing protein
LLVTLAGLCCTISFVMTDQERDAQERRKSYWLESARRDLETANGVYDLKRFDWSLFICHLALEKLLKALIVQAGETPLPIHNLNRLSEMAGLDLSDEHQDWLTEITDFNIEARYDDAKLNFYRKATEEYASLWRGRCNELFLCFEKKLQ